MKFDVNTVNKLLGIDDSYKAPEKMLKIMLNDEKRVELFKEFLEISTDMTYEWFQEYFEDEQAQRKEKKQDFTPTDISNLSSRLVNLNKHQTGKYFEATAGTGGMLIAKWQQDRLTDPVNLQNTSQKDLDKNPGIAFFTYDPKNYWYQEEELSDRAIPFLIFNMAIRGMNGVVIQCDSLTRQTKAVYFIRNMENLMSFSEVIEMPHSKALEDEYNIKEWVTHF